MTTASNSRKGKRIARMACDLCRERKVQCIFLGDSNCCSRCQRADVRCTFLQTRKPRGPVSKLIESKRAAGIDDNQTSQSSPRPLVDTTLNAFCPHTTFSEIITDFLELVYPVLPIIHRPSFQHLYETDEHVRSPSFMRLCLSVAAATIASLPRKLCAYSQGTTYSSVAEMVKRAIQMVHISRAMEEPDYASYPTIELLNSSLLLSVASHYVALPDQGWLFANEAMLFTRTMGLSGIEGYKDVPLIEAELRKRAFWVGYIIQIHDRISHVVPHTGLSYLPRETDWDYIIPVPIDDEHLVEPAEGVSTVDNENLVSPTTPCIVGFVALIQVFKCCSDLFSYGIPGSINHAYSMAAGPLDNHLFPASPESTASAPASFPPTKGIASIFNVFQRLGAIMDSLPTELKVSDRAPSSNDRSDHTINQFDIMRANVHITSLYLQSTILETFASNTRAVISDARLVSEEAGRVKAQIWALRESICRELLSLLESCPPWTLEANGSSMILKIREIAATLLDEEDNQERFPEDEELSRAYVEKFVEILTSLDWGARMQVSTPN